MRIKVPTRKDLDKEQGLGLFFIIFGIFVIVFGILFPNFIVTIICEIVGLLYLIIGISYVLHARIILELRRLLSD